MTSERPSVDDIFLAAIERRPEDRSAYLNEVCGGDPDLRNRVERLLLAKSKVIDFLESPAPELHQPESRPITEQPGDMIGPYKLLQQIGEGGMGVVYMAQQTEPVERRVALKIIKPGMDTHQVIARFEAERQALAMMDHPNIAKVHDAGTTETGRPYFVMELVKGIPVTQYCDKKQLTPRERLELFVPICQAVQHAHQKGIIHRDVKPSNVLVAEYDDRAVPKIIDFGVAKAIEQRLTEKTVFTEFGQVVGTIEYMSPEQAKFNQLDIDTRTDIYSLGVLLYELLTGETPFDPVQLRSAAFDEMLRIIREEEPPRPSLKLSTSESLPAIAANRHVEPTKLSTLVHGELDWIVMKALEKDRARRYETASKFAEDVQHHLKDEAVTACPPSAAYRFRKFARRNKAAITTCAAIAAALIVGTAVATWQAVRATHQRDRAVAAEAKAEKEAGRADAEANKAKQEAERADAEARKAKEEADIANEVVIFLQTDLFGMASAASQAEAQMSPDPDIKLRTLLDRAAERVEERFSDQPRVQAAICYSIGVAYQSIGDYQKAESFLLKSLESRRRTLGEDHHYTLCSMNALAINYRLQGHYEEAEALDLKVLELCRPTLGEEHPNTIATMQNLAVVYLGQARHEEAEALLREVLEIRRRTLGDEHSTTLSCMNDLALVYASQEHYEKAVGLFCQTLELRRRTLGEAHPYTLTTMYNLAGVYKDQARYEQAESLFDQVLKIQRRALGEEHPVTVRSMHNLAGVYLSQARYDEAESLFDEVLRIQRRALGEEHPETLSTINNLASLYDEQGRYGKAETLNRQTLEIRRRTLGDEHPHTLTNIGNLATTHYRQGHYKEAEILLRRTLDIRRRKLGDEDSSTLNTMNTLAAVYGAQGRYEEGEALHRQTLEIQRRTLGEEHPQTLNSMVNLAVAYTEQDRECDAEPLLKQVLEIQHRTLGDEHPQTLTTMRSLAVVYMNQGRYEEAETLVRRALEIGRRTLGEEHPDMLIGMLRLARTYRHQGRYEEAEKLLGRTLEISNRTLGEEQPNTLTTTYNLALTYLHLGRYEEAKTLFRRTLEISRRTLGEEHPITVATLSSLSWLLATAADPAERDPVEAVELAKRATELQPDRTNRWANLGVALYRKGEFPEAVKALEKARSIRGDDDPEYQFFVAMAYWQAGQRDQALDNYKVAAAWLENGDRGEEQRRFADEAANLIKPNDPTGDSPSKAGNQELSDE